MVFLGEEVGASSEKGEWAKTGWWKKITEMVEGRDGEWFWVNTELQLGEGGLAGFLDGRWAGDKLLKDRFPCLFQLSDRRDGLVKDMDR